MKANSQANQAENRLSKIILEETPPSLGHKLLSFFASFAPFA